MKNKIALLFVSTAPKGNSTSSLLKSLTTEATLVHQTSIEDPILAVDDLRMKLDQNFFDDYTHLLIASDDLLGPLTDLRQAFAKLDDNPADFVSLADCTPGTDFDEPKCEPFFALLKVDLLGDARLWVPSPNPSISLLARRARALGYSISSLYSSPGGNSDLFARAYSTPDSLKQLPFLPWSLFTANPLLLERWGVTAAPALKVVQESDYPMSHFWDRLLHSAPPQTWYTNLALLDIFSTTEEGGPLEGKLNTAVIAHVFYPEMLTEILEYAHNVPSPASLFVTTDTEKKQREIQAQLQNERGFDAIDVRVVKTNRGRDISAFLLDCKDVLLDPRFDLVVKLHSKKSAQDPASVSESFRRHLFENLLATASYAQQVFALFEADSNLGMVFPPVVHMGLPTMGNGWTLNRAPAEKIAKDLGITIPFDETTPLSPFGSMFIARRQALEPLARASFSADVFPTADQYRDGSFAHALERLFSYVVFNAGFYARCVQNTTQAQISSVNLQYKLNAVASYLHPHTINQVRLLESSEDFGGWKALRRQVAHQLNRSAPVLGHLSAKMWNITKRALKPIRPQGR